MVKIIATSAYGESPRYIVGAKRQYALAKLYYPDWQFRLYTDDGTKFADLTDAVIVEVKDNSHGVFWRFAPLFESEDNVVIVRDSDGRITEREAMAVNEWLLSNKKFHVYRDHEAHFQYPVIACAFGYKGMLSEHLHNIMMQFSTQTNYYTNDQVYLRDFVWPFVEKETLIHTLHDGWFGETRSKLVNEYDFCGNGYDEFDMPLYPNTLEKCAGFDPKNVDIKYKYNGKIVHA